MDVAAHARIRPDGISYAGKIFVKKYKRNCGRAECPVCYEAWAAKEAHKAEKRIRAFKPSQFRRVVHVVVSPSQKDIDTMDYQGLRERAYFVLKKVGIWGGIVIIHPFRENHQDKSWYLSPHFHVLGYGWVSNVGEEYQETGWIVKNLGIRQSTYATLLYQLSHAGIYMKLEGEKGKSTVTWFGALSYNKFRAPEEEARDICPICEQKLVPIRFTGEGDPPLLTFDNLAKNDEFFIEYVVGKQEWEEIPYYER